MCGRVCRPRLLCTFYVSNKTVVRVKCVQARRLFTSPYCLSMYCVLLVDGVALVT